MTAIAKCRGIGQIVFAMIALVLTLGAHGTDSSSATSYGTLIDGLADAETAAVLRAALGQAALFDMQEALCAALLDFWIQRD